MIEFTPEPSDVYTFVHKLEVRMDKKNQGIVGILLAHVAQDAFNRGFEGAMMCLSKTALLDYYVHRYGCSRIANTNRVMFHTTSTISYQPNPFVAGDHIVVIRANWLNKYTGLFIKTLLNQERYRYSYGRAFKMDLIKRTKLLLPVNHNKEVDWRWIENYIQTLPYSENI